MATLRALVFIRRAGAFGLGHTAWAFELRTGWFNAGSVENFKGLPVAQPADMGFWTMHTLNPVQAVQKQLFPYDEYKIFDIPNAKPWDAWETILWLSQQPYIVVERNCVDDAYDVLRSFGDDNLILPSRSLIPNLWYNQLKGESHHITASVSVPLRSAAAVAQYMPVLNRDRQLTIAIKDRGQPPPWRRDGTTAWKALQEALTLSSGQADATPTP